MKKIKMLMAVLGMAFMVLSMMSSASALTINPSSLPIWSGDIPNNPKADDIPGIVGSIAPLFELYKQDVSGPESGDFASSYETAFDNTPTDPEDAVITWVEGMPFISGSPLYLLVKDGSQTPIWYIFGLNIGASPLLPWNGQETIYLNNFWPGNGAISHVSIYGPTSVPEPSTLLLLGSGLIGLGILGRKRFKRI